MGSLPPCSACLVVERKKGTCLFGQFWSKFRGEGNSVDILLISKALCLTIRLLAIKSSNCQLVLLSPQVCWVVV